MTQAQVATFTELAARKAVALAAMAQAQSTVKSLIAAKRYTELDEAQKLLDVATSAFNAADAEHASAASAVVAKKQTRPDLEAVGTWLTEYLAQDAVKAEAAAIAQEAREIEVEWAKDLAELRAKREAGYMAHIAKSRGFTANMFRAASIKFDYSHPEEMLTVNQSTIETGPHGFYVHCGPIDINVLTEYAKVKGQGKARGPMTTPRIKGYSASGECPFSDKEPEKVAYWNEIKKVPGIIHQRDVAVAYKTATGSVRKNKTFGPTEWVLACLTPIK